MSERAGYDALIEHFQRADHRQTAEQIAHNAIAVLLALPEAERMKAMGMTVAAFTDGHGRPCYRDISIPCSSASCVHHAWARIAEAKKEQR